MIDEYKFGSITIEEEVYDYDVEVRWTGEVLRWQRKEDHLFDVESVKRAVEQSPDVIVLGTGESGAAEVAEDCRDFIREKGIELIADRTAEAVRTFNVILQDSLEEEGVQRRVIGLFHLTC